MTAITTSGPLTLPIHRDRLLVGGEWVSPSGTGSIEVIGAASEGVVGSVPEGGADDVDAAVGAARAALEVWSATPPRQRARLLEALAAELERRAAEVAALVSTEVGMPLRMATQIQAGLPVITLRTAAGLLEELPLEERVGNSLVLRRPVGVVAAITPWNYPLHQAVAKVAPALAAGCCVVLKPSEVAPLTAFVLAEASLAAGLPPGVLNVVTGFGPVVGEALATHPGVDMVSFTGSTRAGRRVAMLAAETVKRVALELGGKSANILLDDCDLERAVTTGVNVAFLNSGQTCTAWTRMLVPAGRQQEVCELAVAAAQRLTVGDPFAEGTRLGPLASAAQRDRVRGYITTGVREGARLVTGGPEAPDGLATGYYVRPTVFADVDSRMTIAQEEIFGPVLSILPYTSEDDAVSIANDTIYGLSGAVWSADEEHAVRVARRLRTGGVDINGGRFNPLAPFGGWGQSGLGRELGRFGIEEFLELTSLQL